MSVKPLRKFILDNFDGKNNRFAEWFGTSPTQVTRWIKMGCIFYDDSVYKKQCKKKPGARTDTE